MIALLLLVSTGAGAQAPEPAPSTDYYVAPSGSDQNPGTEKKPFGTLRRAQAAVRARIAVGLRKDVRVLLSGGRYELTQPLVFGPPDAGTAEYSITYAADPHSPAILSGGRKVLGWKKGEGELWTAQVPGVKEGEWYPRQLLVDGRRAIRARTPNADTDPPGWRLAGAELSADAKTYTLKLAPGEVKAWGNVSDVEVNVFGEWETMRKRLVSVDEAAATITLQGPHVPLNVHPWNRPAPGKGFYLENAREFLDQPGEWYLDRATGIITYWPRRGEDMARAEVIAPALTHLIEVAGTAESPVRNLHFQGLGFEHADWPLPEGGYQGTQACHFSRPGGNGWGLLDAALHFTFAEGCSVTDGDLAHLGGCGLFLDEGCSNNVVEGNRVFDIGGNGLEVSAPDTQAPAPKGNRIANNQIHNCGVDYQGAVGLWDGLTEGTVISHNLVHDLPYTGISVGWQWNPEPTNCQANLIEYNHIYGCMKMLSDGGGIYTLGFQPGTIIRGNVIHNIARSAFAVGAPNNGMFIDEGSKGFLIEGNVIWATSGTPVRHNQNVADWHIWKDNRFGIVVPVEGKIGTGLLCDGSSTFFEPPNSAAIDPPQLTVEAWVKVDAYPTGGDTRRWVVNKNDDEWTQGNWSLVTQGSDVGAYLNIGGGQQNSFGAWSTTKPLTLKTWHHLAMTYDGSVLRVYCDGKPVAETKIDRPRVPGNTPIAIGRRQDAYNYFAGVIDEVRVYDRALPASEIKAHRDKPAKPDTGTEKGLVGYWGFDDLAADQEAVKQAIAKAGPEADYVDMWKAMDASGSATVEF